MARPVTIVAENGVPITNAVGHPPLTPVIPGGSVKGGPPVVLVVEGGKPFTLVNEDGSAWVAP